MGVSVLGPPRPSLAWVSSTSWQLPVLIVALAGWICWLAARRRRETMKCAAVSGRRARARMNEGPVLSSTIATIQAQLQATADPSYKAWSERYMRGAVRCRGVRVPAVVRLAADWWPSASHLSAQRLDMAFQLITSEYAEDKLAGIVCLQLTVPPKHWLARSPPSHVSGDSTAILDRVKETYDGGYVSEWATGDQLCTRVLGPLVQAHGRAVAEEIAGWATAPNLWRRRAAAVALRAASADAAYHNLLHGILSQLLPSEERFIQTGVGWLLADLARRHPDVAATWVEEFFDSLSREVIDRHTRRLPQHAVYRQRKRKRPIPTAT